MVIAVAYQNKKHPIVLEIDEEDIFVAIKKAIIRAMDDPFVTNVELITSISIETNNEDYFLAFPPFTTAMQKEVVFETNELIEADIIEEEDLDYGTND